MTADKKREKPAIAAEVFERMKGQGIPISECHDLKEVIALGIETIDKRNRTARSDKRALEQLLGEWLLAIGEATDTIAWETTTTGNGHDSPN